MISWVLNYPLMTADTFLHNIIHELSFKHVLNRYFIVEIIILESSLYWAHNKTSTIGLLPKTYIINIT